jgi:hypothetical protein
MKVRNSVVFDFTCRGENEVLSCACRQIFQ